MTGSVEQIVGRLRAAGCVFAEEEAALLVETGGCGLDERIARRAAGEPLETVLGWAEFAGLRIVVETGVFVPRRRSELLVQEAVRLARRGSVVVDLCCGSGAIGAAVAARVPGAEVYGADVDPGAVACAAQNLPAERVFAGDLFAALPMDLRGRIDVLVVNAPYVPSDEIAFMPREARLYEPSAALDGGADGLDWHRRIAAGAADWLTLDGTLLIETSRPQAAGTRNILISFGFGHVRVIRSDDLDATIVKGQRRSSGAMPRSVHIRPPIRPRIGR